MLVSRRFRLTGKMEVIAVPLSEYEQRVLNQLEQQLASQDPSLEAKFSSQTSPRRGRVAVGLAGGLAGLAVLVFGMVVGRMWVSLIGFVLMFAGVYWALTRPGAAKMRAVQTSKPSKPRRQKLSDRFEKRWEDRGHN